MTWNRTSGRLKGPPRKNLYRVSVRCSGGAVVDLDVVAVSAIEAPRVAFAQLTKQGERPLEETATKFLGREARP